MPAAGTAQNRSVMAFNMLHKVADQDERVRGILNNKLEQII